MDINNLKKGGFYCIDNGDLGYLIIQIVDDFVAKVMFDTDENPHTRLEKDFKVIINTYKDKDYWEVTQEELDHIILAWEFYGED